MVYIRKYKTKWVAFSSKYHYKITEAKTKKELIKKLKKRNYDVRGL